MAALLLVTAASQRGTNFGAILRAALGLQAQCLASRSCKVGSSSVEGAPANGQPQRSNVMRNLTGTMINTASVAQEAACQLLLKQHKVGQVPRGSWWQEYQSAMWNINCCVCSGGCVARCLLEASCVRAST